MYDEEFVTLIKQLKDVVLKNIKVKDNMYVLLLNGNAHCIESVSYKNCDFVYNQRYERMIFNVKLIKEYYKYIEDGTELPMDNGCNSMGLFDLSEYVGCSQDIQYFYMKRLYTTTLNSIVNLQSRIYVNYNQASIYNNFQDSDIFKEVTLMKSDDGANNYNIPIGDKIYRISLFKGLIPYNKNDIVDLRVIEEPFNNIFIFSVSSSKGICKCNITVLALKMFR